MFHCPVHSQRHLKAVYFDAGSIYFCLFYFIFLIGSEVGGGGGTLTFRSVQGSRYTQAKARMRCTPSFGSSRPSVYGTRENTRYSILNSVLVS